MAEEVMEQLAPRLKTFDKLHATLFKKCRRVHDESGPNAARLSKCSPGWMPLIFTSAQVRADFVLQSLTTRPDQTAKRFKTDSVNTSVFPSNLPLLFFVTLVRLVRWTKQSIHPFFLVSVVTQAEDLSMHGSFWLCSDNTSLRNTCVTTSSSPYIPCNTLAQSPTTSVHLSCLALY